MRGEIDLWEQIKQVLHRIFGARPKDSNSEFEQNKADVEKYQDINKENFTAIFSNALSTLAFGDSSANVILDKNKVPTKRVELLDDVLQRCWKNIKQNIAVGNGCGMIASIPYVSNGKIYIDTVTKNQFFVTVSQGEDVTACAILADSQKINSNHYCRWVEHRLENSTYTIKHTATKNNKECELSEVAEWANIVPEITIQNVTRLPIGIYRCPTSNRRPKTITGVPITYGCDSTLNKIYQCLTDIEKEFEHKSVKIFADGTLFDKSQKLTDLYVKIVGGNLKQGNSIDVFDPAFRETAYYTKLNQLFTQLEREVGTSRGILTDLSVSNATATEIRRAMLQTFNLCDDIRTNTEEYITDLMYGCNVLANAFNLTPASEYQIVYDWSYSMLEDSTVSFNQLLQGKSVGAVSSAEIRNYIKSSETMEESQKAVEDIAKNEPSLSNLIGE